MTTLEKLNKCTKNSNPIGTFGTPSFQYSFKTGSNVYSPNIKTFSGLGILTIPHIGTYGDSYWPTTPIVLIELPTDDIELLKKVLPTEIINLLKDSEQNNAKTIEFYFIIHTTPESKECPKFICQNFDEANVMYHAWTFKDIEFTDELDIKSEMKTGLFNSKGIHPVHLDLVDGGISFNSLSNQNVIIHSSSFSPENGSFRINYASSSFCSFFSFASTSNRIVIAHHTFFTNNKDEKNIIKLIQDVETLNQLISGIKEFHSELGSDFETFFTPFCFIQK